MLLNLDKAQQRHYTRLYVSRSDFIYVRSCGRLLLKKGWHNKPWERRGSIYFQQSAYTAAMVTAYGRPFTSYKDWEGYLLKLLGYGAQQLALHKTLINMRHQIYAHSDTRRYNIRPWRSGDFETDIVGEPFLLVPKSDCEQLLTIGERACAALSNEMQRLTARINQESDATQLNDGR